jgi:pilus assembly protein TadC
MRTLKFLLLSALFLFVGIPCLFVLFVMGMAMFGVVFGVGMALVGILLAIVKVALMVIIPVAIVLWLVKRLTTRDRVYR